MKAIFWAALLFATPALAQDAPFQPTEITQHEVWVYACKMMIAPYMADDCEQGPDSKRFAAASDLHANIRGAWPKIYAHMKAQRQATADRMNMAYRVLIREGKGHADALVMVRDQSIVKALIDAEAGISRR